MPQTSTTAVSERRRSPRDGHVIEGWISPTDSSMRREVTAVDISREGVGFTATFPLPKGSEQIFQIGYGEQSLICKIRIAGSRSAESGIWHIGAEFI
jgi:hypothetical protein